MILRSGTGDALELTVERYPREQSNAGWLEIRIDAVAATRAWAVTDPLVASSEVGRLADWLDAVAAGSSPEPLRFTEPELGFERSGAAIRVLFERKAIELDPDPDALRAAAAELRTQLTYFEERG